MNDKERKALQRRYQAAAHGMQTGVAHKMGFTHATQAETEPKHLRVGINSAMSDHAALARLLMKKGVITEDEYLEAICVAMEEERDRYEREIQDLYGNPNMRLS